jgi:hypothetical protein
LLLHLLQGLGAITLWLQQFPSRTVVNLTIGHRVVHGLGGDGGDDQARTADLDQDPGEVINMKALLGEENQTLGWIVEPAHGCIAKPVAGAGEKYLRVGVVGLDGVINNQSIATATGQDAADRGCQAVAATGRLEFALGNLPRIEPRLRKKPLAERAFHQGPAVARETCWKGPPHSSHK